jgi:hypothetical protein
MPQLVLLTHWIQAAQFCIASRMTLNSSGSVKKQIAATSILWYCKKNFLWSRLTKYRKVAPTQISKIASIKYRMPIKCDNDFKTCLAKSSY